MGNCCQFVRLIFYHSHCTRRSTAVFKLLLHLYGL